MDSDCDSEDYVCEGGECKWRGNPVEGCNYSSDCDEGQICEEGECVSEGSNWVTWLIVILVVILGAAGGYFGYKQYFSKKKLKSSVGSRPLPARKSPLGGAYPSTAQKVPARTAAIRQPTSDTKGDRLERELDQSLKKAKDLLRKK